eukprot:jgi/Undpi1/10658/HiC_scaffold_29.g13107.m1
MTANAVPLAVIDGKQLSDLAKFDLERVDEADLCSCIANLEQIRPLLRHTRFVLHNPSAAQLAAITIQAAARRFLERSGFLLLKRKRSAVFALQCLARGRSSRRLTQSGMKRVFAAADVSAPIGAHDVYDEEDLMIALTKLIAGHLDVQRWHIKVDVGTIFNLVDNLTCGMIGVLVIAESRQTSLDKALGALKFVRRMIFGSSSTLAPTQARYTANSTAVLQRMRSEDVGHVPSQDATGVKTTTEAGERQKNGSSHHRVKKSLLRRRCDLLVKLFSVGKSSNNNDSTVDVGS